MIAIATKLCRACGTVKPRGEFWVNQYRPSGIHKLQAKCKVCQKKINADRKRKGVGEYRTLAEIRRQSLLIKRLPVLSETDVERDRWKRDGRSEWVKVLMAASQPCRAKAQSAWSRKMEAISSGFRVRPIPVLRDGNQSQPSQDMIAALVSAYRAWNNRHAMRARNPWEKKMGSIARNWRRKTLPT